jgi:hypothetical protein
VGLAVCRIEAEAITSFGDPVPHLGTESPKFGDGGSRAQTMDAAW